MVQMVREGAETGYTKALREVKGIRPASAVDPVEHLIADRRSR